MVGLERRIDAGGYPISGDPLEPLALALHWR